MRTLWRRNGIHPDLEPKEAQDRAAFPGSTGINLTTTHLRPALDASHLSSSPPRSSALLIPPCASIPRIHGGSFNVFGEDCRNFRPAFPGTVGNYSSDEH